MLHFGALEFFCPFFRFLSILSYCHVKERERWKLKRFRWCRQQQQSFIFQKGKKLWNLLSHLVRWKVTSTNWAVFRKNYSQVPLLLWHTVSWPPALLCNFFPLILASHSDFYWTHWLSVLFNAFAFKISIYSKIHISFRLFLLLVNLTHEWHWMNERKTRMWSSSSFLKQNHRL